MFNHHVAKIKEYVLYEYYSLFGTIAVFITATSFLVGYKNWQITTTLLGGAIGFIYFVQKQKLEESKFFKELFGEFNQRYIELSSDLLPLMDNKHFEQQLRTKLVRYFILCAEEYLLYRKGYIPHSVWHTWLAGMAHYWKNPSVQIEWSKEQKTHSYYNFDPYTEFKRNNIKIKVTELRNVKHAS